MAGAAEPAGARLSSPASPASPAALARAWRQSSAQRAQPGGLQPVAAIHLQSEIGYEREGRAQPVQIRMCVVGRRLEEGEHDQAPLLVERIALDEVPQTQVAQRAVGGAVEGEQHRMASILRQCHAAAGEVANLKEGRVLPPRATASRPPCHSPVGLVSSRSGRLVQRCSIGA
jgi:hypothetical protein